MKCSILEYIQEHIKDGKLERNFSLEEYHSSWFSVPFADGAVDGIAFFHGPEEPDKKTVDFLTERVNMKTEYEVERTYDEIEEFFRIFDTSIIYSVDAVKDYICKHWEQIEQRNLFLLAEKLMRESETVNGVKYGIVLAGLFPERWDELEEAFKGLALTEEFAVYINTNILNSMDNGNDLCFEMAQKLQGWGKVFAVIALDNTNETIENWLVAQGADNVISPGYVSASIIEKIGVDKLFARVYGEEEVNGLSCIMDGLLFDAPLHDLNNMINRDELVKGFIEIRDKWPVTIRYYGTLLDLYYWCDTDEKEDDFIINTRGKLAEIFTDEKTGAFLQKTLPECDSFDFNKLTQLAMLDDSHDYTDLLYERFMEDACMYCGAIPYLMNSRKRSLTADKLDEPRDFSAYLSDEFVDLVMLNLGYMLDQLEAFPFTGIQYVEAGLHSRFSLTRSAALECIASWLLQRPDVALIEYPDSIYEALSEMSEKEEIEDLRDKANEILNVDSWASEQGSGNVLPS